MEEFVLKITILSSFTQPCVISNPYDCHLLNKKGHFKLRLLFLFNNVKSELKQTKSMFKVGHVSYNSHMSHMITTLR